MRFNNNQLRVPGIVSVLLLAFVSLPAEAQLTRSTAKVGTTAAQFLKIGVGARSIGMGNAQAAVLGDVSALYWNPAALPRMNVSSELMFNHAEWLADVSYDYAAGMMHLGDFGTVGLSFVSLAVPEDIVRTENAPEGDGRKWDAGSIAIGLTYARNLTDRFSLGVNAKFIRERIWNESATGFGFDVGTMYLTEIPGLTLGAMIANFGTRMQLSGRDLAVNVDPNNNVGSGPNNVPADLKAEEYELPLSLIFGVAYELHLPEDFRWTTAVDAANPNDNTEHLNMGMEFAWREILFGRIGYKALFLRDTEQGLTWGVGVHYGIVNSFTVKLDYGFADYGRLKNVQYLTLSIGMN
ncbi:MAG TPA: PorV/PorQ family protein [Bacteroidota bacterium]